MSLNILLSLLLIFPSALHALPRLWKSPAGQREISGEFIQRDATTVTIRDADGKLITTPLANLHPYDLRWVETMHPLSDPAAPATNQAEPPQASPPQTHPEPAPSGKTAVFDQLVFGDPRKQVFSKLKASQFVVLTIDDTYLGRTGLNGVFRTRKKIGGLDASLFFDWTENGRLKELTLQTEALPESAYQSQIEPSWREFVTLLTTLYGKPVQAGYFPNISHLGDGSFSPSHLWPLEAGGSVLLGTARDNQQYQLVVRFTQKKIQPVALP